MLLFQLGKSNSRLSEFNSSNCIAYFAYSDEQLLKSELYNIFFFFPLHYYTFFPTRSIFSDTLQYPTLILISRTAQHDYFCDYWTYLVLHFGQREQFWPPCALFAQNVCFDPHEQDQIQMYIHFDPPVYFLNFYIRPFILSYILVNTFLRDKL